MQLVKAEREISRVLRDPSTSDWLRYALTSILDRDCADAVADAELLYRLIEARTTAILGE